MLDCQDGSPLDQHGTVTFEARWRDRDRREGVLRECSRFGRGESGEWLYLEALSLGVDSRAKQESGLLGVLGTTCRHPTCGYGFGSRVRHCFDRHVA